MEDAASSDDAVSLPHPKSGPPFLSCLPPVTDRYSAYKDVSLSFQSVSMYPAVRGVRAIPGSRNSLAHLMLSSTQDQALHGSAICFSIAMPSFAYPCGEG